MEKNSIISGFLNDRDYWKQTARAVEEDLPINYAAEVIQHMESQGIEGFTEAQVRDVKLGRNKGLRVVALAIYEVGLKYRSKKESAAV